MRWVVVVALAVLLSACVKELTLLSTGDGDASGTSGTSTEPAVPTTTNGSSSTSAAPTTSGAETSGTTAATSGETGSSSGDSSSGEAESSSGTTMMATSESGDETTGSLVRPFDCYGCLCDADISYCQQVFAGVTAPPPGPAEECPVVLPDTLDSGCVAFPDDCGATPSCKCLPNMKGACYCTQPEPGMFEVVCPLP